ncbi:DUF2631 domain-containing protein [[Mycobacterium] crassicus]|uniref:DUF2631 domain-containing protein n=1 Tax=[Mycobacterium] crassicus TaxID=2872309 RepID=A0ABU5XKN5_9MYCO|nr:DUF2631 domain-containing protein [Mycolicibacter sp. MYC098]MEB3022332.1 DUF2631 domain-containing protein [Mycolicibacter sp. MYC098]
MAGTEVERRTGVDPADVPSVGWGWSEINYRTWHFVGLGIVGFLLLMLHGNHIGHVEDYFVVAFAVLTLVVVLRDMIGRKRGWLR